MSDYVWERYPGDSFTEIVIFRGPGLPELASGIQFPIGIEDEELDRLCRLMSLAFKTGAA